MRTIKFRGKRIDNGEWAYGSLVTNHCYGLSIVGRIDHVDGSEYNVADWQVVPETVGQFTGLCDKNGREIYEGDIVKSVCKKRINYHEEEGDLFKIPEFEDRVFYNIIDWYGGIKISGWRIKGKGFQTALKWSTIGNMMIEIIGNIHDNPELLK